jgi:hypothetical protein
MTFDDKNYSHIEVAGEAILPVINAITAKTLCRLLLRKYSLNDVQKGFFYPLDKYLSLLHDIEKRMPATLKKIGMFIMSEAIFPPDITSFEQGLMLSDQAYYMNHKGVRKDEIGHYHFKKISDKTFSMSASSLYPCIFDQGVFIGIAQKFNTVISVKHNSDNCRSKGDPQCDYHISIRSMPDFPR